MKAILTVSFNGALGQVSRSSMAAAARRWGTREQPVLFIIVSEPNAHVAATGVTRVARWEVWQSYPDLRPPEPPGAHCTTSLENLPQTPLGPASMKTEAFEILDLVEAQWLASQRAPCWSCGGPRHREQEPHQVLIIDADTVVSSVCPDPFAEFQMQHPTTMAGARRPLVVVKNGNPERFGDYQAILNCERHEWAKVFNASEASQYSFLNSAPKDYFNSGVMVAQECHRGLFAEAKRYCLLDLGLGWQDQTPLNFVAQLNGGANFVDEKWNFIHPWTLGAGWEDMHKTGKFIYHFAGEPDRAEKIARVKWQQPEEAK